MIKDFTGFILAGGKSSRMGSDKFALEFNGETFLTRAVKVLEPICESVKIVLNQTQNIETNLPIVRDIYENRGALGGIHAALLDCKGEFAVILAVDLPFVTSKTIEKLANIALNKNDFSAFIPQQDDGYLQPLCAVYRVKDCLPEIKEIMHREKSLSVRSFLQTIEICIIEQKDLSNDENLFLNVNTPAEFEKLDAGKV